MILLMAPNRAFGVALRGYLSPPRKLCRARRPAQNRFLFFGITFSSGTRQPNRSGRLAVALELETRKDRENRAKIRTTYQVLKVYKGEMRFAHFTLFVVDDACVVLRELSAEFFSAGGPSAFPAVQCFSDL